VGGAVIGLGFGFLAQRSRFCLRAAVIEFWHRRFGEKLSVWLLAFSAAVIGVQLLALGGLLDTASARQIATRGSLSGALIGGLIFGIGMVLARGCASRLLVLSAAVGSDFCRHRAVRSVGCPLAFACRNRQLVGGRWRAGARSAGPAGARPRSGSGVRRGVVCCCAVLHLAQPATQFLDVGRRHRYRPDGSGRLGIQPMGGA